MKIYEYFKDVEIACQCGCGLMPSTKSIERLYAFRIIMGKPVKVTSGARCKAHNAHVGGAANSPHLLGAFDVDIAPEDEWRAIQAAQAVGFTGIGIKNNVFMHLDDQHGKPTVWTYT